MKTNYRENFLALLRGEQPTDVIWTADLSYWISSRQADGTANPAWETEAGYLELHQALGVMPYFYYQRFWVSRPVYDASVRERTETSGHVTTRLWETPVGTLREESCFLPESACPASDYHAHHSAHSPMNGLASTHRRRPAKLHAAGVKAAVHLDGTVRGLLPKLAAVGFDAVEALTPQPAGDLTPAEMRQLANRTDLILWGGMPGALFPAPTDWPCLHRHLDNLLAAWARQPFIVGVADQVPPDGKIDFCRQIAEQLANTKIHG